MKLIKQYEGQIQKLIDTHITTEKVETITELVNIFDKDKFQQEVENTTGKAAKQIKLPAEQQNTFQRRWMKILLFTKSFRKC
jgi:type I restriction enzyme, R subunit